MSPNHKAKTATQLSWTVTGLGGRWSQYLLLQAHICTSPAIPRHSEHSTKSTHDEWWQLMWWGMSFWKVKEGETTWQITFDAFVNSQNINIPVSHSSLSGASSVWAFWSCGWTPPSGLQVTYVQTTFCLPNVTTKLTFKSYDIVGLVEQQLFYSLLKNSMSTSKLQTQLALSANSWINFYPPSPSLPLHPS